MSPLEDVGAAAFGGRPRAALWRNQLGTAAWAAV